jgi:serine phosphatase RsbU (regulator of sigma subunit)
MTGLRAEDLVGCDIHSFYTAEEWAFLEKKIEESERVGHNRYEFTIPKKDGSRVPVIISARAHEDSDDRRFGIVTFADISEQKLAQKQLREANQQLSEANEQLEEHQKEIEEDLALAARVQQSLAPKPLVWGGLRVEAYYEPVRTIGGDFGLVSPLEEEHLNLLVCDVSGHGVSSALVANRIYTETIARLGSGAPLPEMLRSLNRFVMQHIGSSLFFFTLAAARIDRDARRMVFAGAGHPPAMIARAGREPRLLESRSMILGVLPDAVDPEGTLDVDLDRGDRVVLYTDGMTDVFDARGEMLGVPGVQKFVGETSLLPFAEMKQGILDRVAAWREGPPSDDVSLVLVEVL